MSSATDSAEMISENRISVAVISRVAVGGPPSVGCQSAQGEQTLESLHAPLDMGLPRYIPFSAINPRRSAGTAPRRIGTVANIGHSRAWLCRLLRRCRPRNSCSQWAWHALSPDMVPLNWYRGAEPKAASCAESKSGAEILIFTPGGTMGGRRDKNLRSARKNVFALGSASGKNQTKRPRGPLWGCHFRASSHQRAEALAMSFLRWLKRLLFSRWSPGGAGLEDGLATESAEEPMISLVLLLRQPRYLDEAILRQSVHQAWGIDLSEAGPDATEFIVGDGTPMFIQCRRGTYLVNNIPVAYIEDREQAAQDAKELRVSQSVARARGVVVDRSLEGRRLVDRRRCGVPRDRRHWPRS